MALAICEVDSGRLVLTFCLREPVERPEPEEALRSFGVDVDWDWGLSMVDSPEAEDRPTPESTRLTRFKEGCCCESCVCIVSSAAWTPFGSVLLSGWDG